MNLGIWQILASHHITDIILNSGFSTVILDFEHGDHDLNSLKDSIYAKRSYTEAILIARFPSISHPLITQSIDAGIDGILVSHIETLDDVQRLKNIILSYPEGNRSFSPFVARFGYGKKSISEASNPRLGILIESVSGIERASELLSAGCVDFVYFGAYDLSVELGISGEIFSESILVLLRSLVTICKARGIQIMSLYRCPEELSVLRSINVDTCIAGVDTGHMVNAFARIVDSSIKSS